jgi:hypothetical protein
MSRFGTQGMSISFCYRTTSGARVNAEWQARHILREARRYIPTLGTRVMALQAQGLTEFQILEELKVLSARYRNVLDQRPCPLKRGQPFSMQPS